MLGIYTSANTDFLRNRVCSRLLAVAPTGNVAFPFQPLFSKPSLRYILMGVGETKIQRLFVDGASRVDRILRFEEIKEFLLQI